MTPKQYIEAVCKTESTNFQQINYRMKDPKRIRILHAAMGLETEVGEIMDQLKKHFFYGSGLDEVNLMEELGDLFWYAGVLADVLGYSFEEVWEKNIAKLKARYGDSFFEDRALDRNLEEERNVLEGKK